MAAAEAFADSAITKALKGRTISPDLHAALVKSFKGFYWFETSEADVVEMLEYQHGRAIEAESKAVQTAIEAESLKQELAALQAEADRLEAIESASVIIPEVTDMPGETKQAA
jgi:hypothetical protein